MSNQIDQTQNSTSNTAKNASPLQTEIILDFSKDSNIDQNSCSKIEEIVSSCSNNNEMSIESTLSIHERNSSIYENALTIEISSENSMAVNYTPNDSDSLGSSLPNFSMSPEEARRTVEMKLEGDVLDCLKKIGDAKNIAKKSMNKTRVTSVKLDGNLISPVPRDGPKTSLLNSANLLGTPKPEEKLLLESTPASSVSNRNYLIERTHKIRNREHTPFPIRKTREQVLKKKNKRINNKRRFPRTSTPSPERVVMHAKKDQDQNTLIDGLESLGVNNIAKKAAKIARMEPENLEFEANLMFNPTTNWSISPLTSTAENSFASEDYNQQKSNESFQIYDENFQLTDESKNDLDMSPELETSNKSSFSGQNHFLNKAVTEIDPADLISDDEECEI